MSPLLVVSLPVWDMSQNLHAGWDPRLQHHFWASARVCLMASAQFVQAPIVKFHRQGALVPGRSVRPHWDEQEMQLLLPPQFQQRRRRVPLSKVTFYCMCDLPNNSRPQPVILWWKPPDWRELRPTIHRSRGQLERFQPWANHVDLRGWSRWASSWTHLQAWQGTSLSEKRLPHNANDIPFLLSCEDGRRTPQYPKLPCNTNKAWQHDTRPPITPSCFGSTIRNLYRRCPPTS